MLTASQVKQVNNLSPGTKKLLLGDQLRDAHTLQHAGRIATGHIRVATNANDTDTVTVSTGVIVKDGITTPGTSVIYEFDTGGVITAGRVLVTIGGTAALSATALLTAIQQRQQNALKAAQHATDTTVLDVGTRVQGCALTLATSSGGRVVVQDNAEELTKDDYQIWMLRRTVTAEDDTRDRVRIDTGLTSIVSYVARIRTSATSNVELAYDGTVTVTGGVIDMANDGSTDLAAGNVISLVVLGTLA